MKTLISQAEFIKIVGAKSKGTISKWVRDGKLPSENGKLIMPDAEKAYYRYKGGVIEYTPTINKSNYDELPINFNDGTQGKASLFKGGINLTLPADKEIDIYFNDHKITLYSFENNDCMSVISSNTAMITMTTNNEKNYQYPFMELNDAENSAFAVVDDDKKIEVIESIDGLINDHDNNVYLLTKSELIELIKEKLGNKRYL